MTIFPLIMLLLILVLPLVFKYAEEQIETFLFIMGLILAGVTGQWSAGLVKEMLIEPVKITIAVLAAGLIFMLFHETAAKQASVLLKKSGTGVFVFILVALLGVLSSVITAVIAALVLAETVKHLKLPRKNEVRLVIIACFSIGLGAALTPIGEPLSTITIAKLRGMPYNAGFWFLMKNMWLFILPGILGLGFAAMKLAGGKKEIVFDKHARKPHEKENIKGVLLRTVKVYVFIMGLVLLGKGFEPLITAYISRIPYYFLYWINSVSAALDNATMAAAEISPAMSLIQIKTSLLGLIVAGGMLIPGNIPNIIVSNKLKITSREWAAFALPLGLALMAVYFIIIMIKAVL